MTRPDRIRSFGPPYLRPELLFPGCKDHKCSFAVPRQDDPRGGSGHHREHDCLWGWQVATATSFPAKLRLRWPLEVRRTIHKVSANLLGNVIFLSTCNSTHTLAKGFYLPILQSSLVQAQWCWLCSSRLESIKKETRRLHLRLHQMVKLLVNVTCKRFMFLCTQDLNFYSRANCNAENVELFVNTLEALVETCLPIDEVEEGSNYDSLLSASSNVKLSSSLTSISLVSPTEKNVANPFWYSFDGDLGFVGTGAGLMRGFDDESWNAAGSLLDLQSIQNQVRMWALSKWPSFLLYSHTCWWAFRCTYLLHC